MTTTDAPRPAPGTPSLPPADAWDVWDDDVEAIMDRIERTAERIAQEARR